jgi:geranylgeranyl pyrophosphate synthase
VATTRKVGAALLRAIASACPTDEMGALLRRLLARRGFALAAEGNDRWAPSVLQTARALGAVDECAMAAVAAAVECAIAAIDIADDLVDDEWDEADIDPKQALNACLALAFLAQYCAGDRPAIQAMLAHGALGSCAGQDLDLLLEGTTEVNERSALRATVAKS